MTVAAIPTFGLFTWKFRLTSEAFYSFIICISTISEHRILLLSGN